MILPSRDYRDPLTVLIERENGTCKGCAHVETVRVFGEDALICHKHRKPVKRCKHYEETTE